jgi:hypothetical protein
VYRALNWGTGETVAIKQVKLVDLPKGQSRAIMVSLHPEPHDYLGTQGLTCISRWKLICSKISITRTLSSTMALSSLLNPCTSFSSTPSHNLAYWPSAYPD